MTATDDKSIDLACRGLQAAVKKYCKKRKRDASSPTNKTVQHACHILRQLTLKRRSLEQGLSCLEQSWKNSWVNTLNNNDTTNVLTHVFHQYLRLRDGMNLMTSGECRHVGDVKDSQKTKFPSRLNKQSERNDGYTKLYSSEHYSGYGWDEFFDPNVGVQRRLQQALGNNNCWDTLLDYGAQAFESCLDQHEMQLQVLQGRFDALRNIMVKDLKKKHCPKVNMITQDKMERLEVTLKGGTHVSLERRANAFQVHDVNGCLPNGWTCADWKRAMEYPPPRKTKKRRIIQDSDEEDIVVEPKPVAAVDGLRVEVKNKADTTKGNKLEVSLVDLKEALEVDAEALEKSREGLEAEEVGGEKPREFHNDGAVDETSELKHDVADARTKVERLQRVVARIKEREDDDDEELWDARECLREASMTLGNSLLSLCAVDKDNDSKDTNLQKARDCFREARDLVKKQEEVHQMICQRTNDSSEEARAILRKLLLLRGRAHVNLGIALVEMSHMKCPELVRKGLEKEAATELENAEGCANSIRARAVTDETKGASPSEIAMDRLEADQLDSLANRWLGNTLWHQRRRKEAVVAFEKSSRFFLGSRHAVSDEDMLEVETELGIDCFDACTSLADLALNALEKLQIVVQGHPKRQDCLSRGEELFSMAKEAYKRTSLISANLQKLSRHKSDIVRDNGIITSQEIEKNIEEMNSWWEEKKRGVVLCQKDGAIQSESNPARNDLFSSGPSSPNSSPVKRFTVNESSLRRVPRRCAQGGGGSSSRSIRTGASVLGGAASSASSNRYRKWGDALLPQVKTDSGETIPLIAYPACVPELPPGFKPFRPNQ